MPTTCCIEPWADGRGPADGLRPVRGWEFLRVREFARLPANPLLYRPRKRSGKLSVQTVSFAEIGSQQTHYATAIAPRDYSIRTIECTKGRVSPALLMPVKAIVTVRPICDDAQQPGHRRRSAARGRRQERERRRCQRPRGRSHGWCRPSAPPALNVSDVTLMVPSRAPNL